ncbi:hypothetical protein FAM09_11345 [Niastella caeni]|uniref:Uncharacterized protein n=1 Tax=Niastella caeni TaxID=2569763 RepID=A0A4S8HXG9_9BACT|nr:hypothetical protein [Niastella caeni]THU40448.1 hypothetical protein FAM09_11345 [Niastella caeni]
MDKHKLSKSKVTGKVSANDANPVLNVIINVREPNYVPSWLSLRKKITANIFTADIKKTDLPKLEADGQVISVAINEQLNSL